MSKPPDSVTQTTSTEPPAYLMPYLSRATGMAQNLFEQGPMDYFNGNTVVPFSPITEQAMNMQMQRASGGSPLVGSAQSFTNNLLSGNSPLNQNFTGGPTGSGVLSPFTSGNPTGDFTGGATGQEFLTPFTSGRPSGNFTGGQTGERVMSQFFDGTNPYLDATFNKAAGAVNRNLDTVLARSGRDLHGNLGARSDALNNLATDIYGGAYEGDRNRALSAASDISNQIFSGGQSDLNRSMQTAESAQDRGLNAANNIASMIYGGGQNDLNRRMQTAESAQDRALNAATNISNQTFGGGQADLDRSLQAASTLGSQQLGALGQALPLAREDYFDIAQLGGVGSQVEQQSQNIINDRMNRYNYAQEAPYAALDRFISQINGIPSGQQSSSTQPVFNNPMGNLLGGALAGGSLFGAGGPLAGMMGLSGAGGAGAGALLGLLSDRRKKENIRRVGQTDSGIPLYVYNYVGDPVRHIGVMADEVKHIDGAVTTWFDGYDRVDYGVIH